MASKYFHRSGSAALLGSTLGLAALCLSGCSGSGKVGASADAKTGADANADANFDVEGNSAWDQVDESQSEDETSATAEPSSPSGSGAQDALAGKLILIGARHDVTVKPGSPTPCQCLSVVLGQPSDPNLVWKKGPPKTNPHEQIVLGLSSKGIACPEQGPGASYMGHIEEGPNIIVTVEPFVEGVPLTEGAILPLPKEGGQVYIQPHGEIPYGKGLDGQARCAVGTGK